jgi:hypothetical protein
MPSSTQDREFSQEMSNYTEVVVNNTALDNALQWIQSNLSPTDVFTRKELYDWASGETVDDIFSKDQLVEWAENNGYLKQ